MRQARRARPRGALNRARDPTFHPACGHPAVAPAAHAPAPVDCPVGAHEETYLREVARRRPSPRVEELQHGSEVGARGQDICKDVIFLVEEAVQQVHILPAGEQFRVGLVPERTHREWQEFERGPPDFRREGREVVQISW